MAKTAYDIEASAYLAKVADALKEIPEFEMPEWAHFVKTSAGSQRPPVESDWWYKRAASILRQAYIRGNVGSGGLSVKYGMRKNRGMRPSKFYRASRKIIRKILQNAEKAGFIEKIKEAKAGRQLTKKGKQFLDSIAEKV